MLIDSSAEAYHRGIADVAYACLYRYGRIWAPEFMGYLNSHSTFCRLARSSRFTASQRSNKSGYLHRLTQWHPPHRQEIPMRPPCAYGCQHLSHHWGRCSGHLSPLRSLPCWHPWKWDAWCASVRSSPPPSANLGSAKLCRGQTTPDASRAVWTTRINALRTMLPLDHSPIEDLLLQSVPCYITYKLVAGTIWPCSWTEMYVVLKSYSAFLMRFLRVLCTLPKALSWRLDFSPLDDCIPERSPYFFSPRRKKNYTANFQAVHNFLNSSFICN